MATKNGSDYWSKRTRHGNLDDAVVLIADHDNLQMQRMAHKVRAVEPGKLYTRVHCTISLCFTLFSTRNPMSSFTNRSGQSQSAGLCSCTMHNPGVPCFSSSTDEWRCGSSSPEGREPLPQRAQQKSCKEERRSPFDFQQPRLWDELSRQGENDRNEMVQQASRTPCLCSNSQYISTYLPNLAEHSIRYFGKYHLAGLLAEQPACKRIPIFQSCDQDYRKSWKRRARAVPNKRQYPMVSIQYANRPRVD